MDSPERIAAWGSVVVLVIGTVSKAIYDFIYNKSKITAETSQKIVQNKQKEMDFVSKNKQKEIDFVLSKYEGLIDVLEQSITEAKEELKKLHVEHLSCREESARFQTRITFLEEKITALEKKSEIYNINKNNSSSITG